MSFGDVDERGTSAVRASIGLGHMLQQAQRADPPANLVSTQATIRVDSVRRGAEKVNTTKTVTSAKENRTNSTLSKDTALQRYHEPCNGPTAANDTAAWNTFKDKELTQLGQPGGSPGDSNWDDPMNTSVLITAVYSIVGISDAEKHFWNCSIYHFDADGNGNLTKAEFCESYNDFQHLAECNTTLTAWRSFHSGLSSRLPGLSGRPVLAVLLAISWEISR